MSSVHDPVLKKQLAYERDHYAKGKNEKLFRKAWPKIKRRMVRAGRHLAEEIVRHAKNEADAVLPVRPKKKHALRKRYSPTLVEVVQSKKKRRVRSVSAKKLRKVRFLAELVATTREFAEQQAKEAGRPPGKKKYIKRPNRVLDPHLFAPKEKLP